MKIGSVNEQLGITFSVPRPAPVIHILRRRGPNVPQAPSSL
jgi:hypothetical protein